MARKKTKAQRQAALALAWDDYFGGGELADWQRLLHDLGIEGDFTSKRQCKKVGRSWQFTDATYTLTQPFTGNGRRLDQHLRLPRCARQASCASLFNRAGAVSVHSGKQPMLPQASHRGRTKRQSPQIAVGAYPRA